MRNPFKRDREPSPEDQIATADIESIRLLELSEYRGEVRRTPIQDVPPNLRPAARELWARVDAMRVKRLAIRTNAKKARKRRKR